MNPRGNPNLGPGPGRPKGSKDKLARDVKERVMQAWDKLEKEGKSLYSCAADDPPWFYKTFVRPMIPKDASVSVGDGENQVIEIRWANERPSEEFEG